MLVILSLRSTKMKVVLSEHNLKVKEGFEQVLDVSEIHMHFNFNYRTFNNDIMLIKVSCRQKITSVVPYIGVIREIANVQHVCLYCS